MSPRATLSLQRGRPAPAPRPRAAPTSSPTTSRRWPSRCSPTASWSRPRPSCRAPTPADVLGEVLAARPRARGRAMSAWPVPHPPRGWASPLVGRGRAARRRPHPRHRSSCIAARRAPSALLGRGHGRLRRARRKLRLDVAPRAAPAAGARRHRRAGSTCGSTNHRAPAARRCSALRDAVVGHPGRRLLVGAARARRASSGAAYRLPTEQRGILADRPADGAMSRSVRRSPATVSMARPACPS